MKLRTVILLSSLLIFAMPAATPAAVTTEKYTELREDAFGAAQGTIVSAAADALSNIAFAFSQGSGELSDLVGNRTDLINQIDAHQKQFDQTYNDKSGNAEANRDRIRNEIRDLQNKLDGVDKEIADKYPRYSELTRPSPMISRDLQALLNPDEAVLVIIPADDATYLFAVTKDHYDWARSTLKADDITKAVQDLRSGLDPSGPTREGTGVEGQENDSSARTSLVFHRQTAYKLYRELVAPLEPLFAGKKVLFTATSGALQSLPLSVLVTDPPPGNDTDSAMLAETHWLIDKYALVTLPAVSSLKTLRCFPLDSSIPVHAGCSANGPGEGGSHQATLDFAGIGNPVLNGKTEDRGHRGTEDYSYYSRGEVADVDRLRDLPALPGTETELKTVASYFPSGAAVLRLGPEATETEVKHDADIGRARIVEFATHALIADEKERIGEPGLVLTPPKTATAEDDGLLSASEVAQLHLSADFVVLSACNTARKDGKLGADGLAGLARAFFYAGARSMLVSNWSISDQATPELMHQIFAAMKNNPAAGRAVAFRDGIEKTKSNTQWREPRYWAPFVLVGDTDERPGPG